MLRDRRQAEDAVQQAYLELVRSADTFRGDGRSLRAWLFRSVRFTCLDEIRRSTRRPETPTAALPERGSAGDGVPDLGLDPELETAMLALSPRQRSLIVLRHVVGLSGAELADAMDMSRPAAYAATERAERRLRKLLSDVESGESTASQSVDRIEERS